MVTKQQIRDWNPCYSDDQLETALDKLFGDRQEITVLDILNSDKTIYENISDVGWLIFRPEVIGERLCHEIGIFAWQTIAKPIWDKYCTNDSRPNDAVECKKRWLNGQATNEELQAREARAAAREARAVASEAAGWAVSWAAGWAASEAAGWEAGWEAGWAAGWAASWELVYRFVKERLSERTN